LKFKWAFAFPGAAATYGQPTSSPANWFVGSEDGTVYALDSGDRLHVVTFKASATVKTAISVGEKERRFSSATLTICLRSLKLRTAPWFGECTRLASGSAHYRFAAAGGHAPLRSDFFGRRRFRG